MGNSGSVGFGNVGNGGNKGGSVDFGTLAMEEAKVAVLATLAKEVAQVVVLALNLTCNLPTYFLQ